MVEHLLKEFEIKYSLVEKIVSFLNKKATRILRLRREIFVDAITELYSIKRACEVRGDNPKQVVSHLSRHLPQTLFLEDDINYEYYPEMVLALRRYYAGEFEPSKKLLVMALLARKFKMLFKESKCNGDGSTKSSVFWFRTINELIHFLYDLKIDVKLNDEKGYIRIKINLPSFLFALIIDGNSVSRDYLHKLLSTSKYGVFFVCYDDRVEVYYPEGCNLFDLVGELSHFTKVIPRIYGFDRNIINYVSSLLESHLISRKNVTSWRLGSLSIDLFNMESDFREFLSMHGYDVDISEPLINRPRTLLPIILMIFSALHSMESIIMKKEVKPKIDAPKEDKVTVEDTTRRSEKEVVVSYLEAKPRLLKKQRLINFKLYVGHTLANYLVSAPIAMENLDKALLLKEILTEIYRRKALIRSTMFFQGNNRYIVHICGKLHGNTFFFCLIEALLAGERMFEWKLATEDTYMLSTPWNTTLLLVVSESLDKVRDKLNKVLSTYAQPLPKTTFEVVTKNCDFISFCENAHIIDVLVLLKNQLWMCRNLTIIKNRFGGEAHIVRVSPDKYMVDMHVEEREFLEILRAELGFDDFWRFLVDFAERKVSFSSFGFKLIAKKKFA